MVVVISVSVLAVILTYQSSRSRYNERSLFVLAFFLVTMIQVIHYDYGTDYMAYFEQHVLYSKNWEEFFYLRKIGHGAFKDMGWAFIQRLFPGKYGFWCSVGIMSIVQNYIYYMLIRDHVKPGDRWKAVAVYLFSTELYVLNFSALRQGFAVALCVGALLLALKNKFLLAMAVILLAVSIHLSALFFLPVVFLTKLNLIHGRLYAIIFLVVASVLYSNITILRIVFKRIMDIFPVFGEKYGHTALEIVAKGSLGFGFLLNSIMYIIMICFLYKRFGEFTKEQKTFVVLVCVPFLIIPFSTSISGIIGRLDTYFTVFEVVAVPLVYSKVRNKIVRIGAGTIYAFMMMYGYYSFFFVTEWSLESYGTFKTIFNVILE